MAQYVRQWERMHPTSSPRSSHGDGTNSTRTGFFAAPLRDSWRSSGKQREGLRAGPAVVEAAWDELPAVIARLAASGAVRLAVLDEASAEEPHRQARSRWAELRARPELTQIQ